MPKGMILAAGRGTRLGPLTEKLPKPLLPVANRPVMAQAIAALQRVGIMEICANVSYRGEQIVQAFGDDTVEGVQLHWQREQSLTGTAGGLKGMQCHLEDELVVVIAGDAMLDVPLSPLVAAHRAAGAFASLATMAVDDPSQYGVVVSQPDGHIVRFQEKPAPGTEISRQANTGIYLFEPEIFSLIPADTFYDFALNVFPAILERKLPFYAFPVEGYWTDIGNPGDYLQANLDFLDGRIQVEGHGERVGDCLIAGGAVVEGSRLSRCVVGDGAVLPRGCTLTECVVWPGTIVAEPITLTAAILTPYGNYQVVGKEIVEVTPVEA